MNLYFHPPLFTLIFLQVNDIHSHKSFFFSSMLIMSFRMLDIKHSQKVHLINQ